MNCFSQYASFVNLEDYIKFYSKTVVFIILSLNKWEISKERKVKDFFKDMAESVILIISTLLRWQWHYWKKI